jgi:hypothetical protein
MTVPPLFAALCDDAALFPPGNAPLPEALAAHERHAASAHAGLVGPFVFPAGRLDELAAVLPAAALGRPLALSLTVPDVAVAAEALVRVRDLPGVEVEALEVAMPADQDVVTLLAGLDAVASRHAGLDVFVEVPRDERRAAVVEALVGTRYRAKLRTGGVVADAHPDEAELARAVALLVGHEVPFKCTAGLHHGVRRTDPETGFEQHGFLNVLAAVAAAQAGADAFVLVGLLAERDERVLVERLRALDADAAHRLRATFCSFGTCSIAEPLDDLLALGLVPGSIPPIPEGRLA